MDYDDASARYLVQVEDTDEIIKVKADNLLQHVRVTLQNIESQAALNNMEGSIIAWNERKQRYNIYNCYILRLLLQLSKFQSNQTHIAMRSNKTKISHPHYYATYNVVIKRFRYDNRRVYRQTSATARKY